MIDLVQMKNEIEKKKSKRDKLLGQKDLLLDSLKELGFKTVVSADKAINKMEKEIIKMENNLTKDTEDFEEKYEDLL